MVSYCKYINIYMLHILFWFSNNIFVAHLDYVQLFCWLCSAAHHINVCLMPILIELHTFLLIWSSQSNVWCALYIIFISHHLPFNLGVVGGSSSYSSLYKHYNSAIGSEPNELLFVSLLYDSADLCCFTKIFYSVSSVSKYTIMSEKKGPLHWFDKCWFVFVRSGKRVCYKLSTPMSYLTPFTNIFI